MPLSKSTVSGGDQYGTPFIGPIDHTVTVLVDVSALDNVVVDADGYLKPGTFLTEGGLLVGTSLYERTSVISGGAAGAHTVTGITTDDELVEVLQVVGGAAMTPAVESVADLTAEFSISDADEIDNAGGTVTTDDQLVVRWRDRSARVRGVVIEPVRVATSNASAVLTAATDIRVALAAVALVHVAPVEDNLGRAITAQERANLPACITLVE